MPVVEFTQKDILRSVLLPPGWFKVHIDAMGEKLASKGDSKNYTVEGTVVSTESGDVGDKNNPIAGVPLDWQFNSKAISMAIPFLNAFGKTVSPGEKIDLDAAEGQDLLVFVARGEWEGREKNDVTGKYRKIAE